MALAIIHMAVYTWPYYINGREVSTGPNSKYDQIIKLHYNTQFRQFPRMTSQHGNEAARSQGFLQVGFNTCTHCFTRPFEAKGKILRRLCGKYGHMVYAHVQHDNAFTFRMMISEN